ncbi:uncharacterized protein LOC34623493 [Cyclospora cayetanensis]|uniref:Uncharacterized protein LOC34623493 n=1 Tax=Cyclospora cayetanensis TaxID=88456 RepID=A0A6P6S1Z4_9EIME|nr:uncharacterized protein LOC34623493 [Cyclospora cayetanensis]
MPPPRGVLGKDRRQARDRRVPKHRGCPPSTGDDSQGPSPCSTASGAEALLCEANSPSSVGGLLLPLRFPDYSLGGPPQRVGSPQYPFTQSMSPANAGEKRSLSLPFCSPMRGGLPDGEVCQGEGFLSSSTGCSPTNGVNLDGSLLGEAAAALARRRLTTGLGGQSPHRGMKGPSPALGVEGDEGAPLSAIAASLEVPPIIEGLLASNKHAASGGTVAQSPRSLLWPKQEQQRHPLAAAAVLKGESADKGEVKDEDEATRQGPQPSGTLIRIPVSSTFTVTEDSDLSGSTADGVLSSFVAAGSQQQQWPSANSQGSPDDTSLLPTTTTPAAAAPPSCCPAVSSPLIDPLGDAQTTSVENQGLPPQAQPQEEQQDVLPRHSKVARRKDTADAAVAAGSNSNAGAPNDTGSSSPISASAVAYPKDAVTDSLFQHPTPDFIDYCIRKHLPANPNPDNLPGIQLERQQKRWCASVYFRGNQFKKRFSSGRWGTLGAFYAAIEWRQVQCRKFQKLKSVGGASGGSCLLPAAEASSTVGTAGEEASAAPPLDDGTVTFLHQQQQQPMGSCCCPGETFLGSPITPPAATMTPQQPPFQPLDCMPSPSAQQLGKADTRSPSPGGAAGVLRPRRRNARRRNWEHPQQAPDTEAAAAAVSPATTGQSSLQSPLTPPCPALVSPTRSSMTSRRRSSQLRGACRGGGGSSSPPGGPGASPLAIEDETDLSAPPPAATKAADSGLRKRGKPACLGSGNLLAASAAATSGLVGSSVANLSVAMETSTYISSDNGYWSITLKVPCVVGTAQSGATAHQK